MKKRQQRNEGDSLFFHDYKGVFRWQAKAEDLERQMEHTHSEEMNRLVTENARLAGELLTLRSQLAEAHHYGNSKDLEAELSSLRHENQRLTSELDNVRSRTEDLNRSIVQADRKYTLFSFHLNTFFFQKT